MKVDKAVTMRRLANTATLGLRSVARASSGSMAVAQTFLVRILVLLLNVVTGIVTARLLGPTGRAEQAAILIGIGLLPFVLSFGLPMAVQYTLRTEPQRGRDLVACATLLSICFGIISIGASLAILPFLDTKYSGTVVTVAEFFMLFAPFAILYNVLCAVLQARSRFSEANFTRYAMPLSTLIGLGILYLAHRISPLSTSIAYIIPYVWVVPWLWVKADVRLTSSRFTESSRRLLGYGSRSYITDLLNTLAAQIDQVLVIGLLSPTSMGIYAVAISAARSSDLFSGPITFVLFPKASALTPQEIVDLTGRITRITLALLTASMACILAAMPIVLPAFYGRSFDSAVPIAQLLVVSFVLGGTINVLSQAFMAIGRPGIMGIIQCVGLATTVPAMIVLIPRFHLLGAAGAVVFSSFIRLAIALASFPLLLKAKVPSIIATTADFYFLMTTLATRMSEGAKSASVGQMSTSEESPTEGPPLS